MGGFMGSLHDSKIAHRDHEPPGRGTRPTQCRPRALTRRFMESLHMPRTCIGTLNRTGVGTARPHDVCGDEPSPPRFMGRILRNRIARTEPLNLEGRRAAPSAPRAAGQSFRPLLRGLGHRRAMSLPLVFGGDALRASHLSPGDVRSTRDDRRQNPRLRFSLRPSSERWRLRGEIRGHDTACPYRTRVQGENSPNEFAH